MKYPFFFFSFRTCGYAVLLLTIMFACSHEKPESRTPSAVKGKTATANSQPLVTTLLATIPDVVATGENGRDKPLKRTVQNIFKIIFNERGRSVAYILETSGAVHAVLNERAGKPYQGIGDMVLSPDGTRVAYSAFDEDRWRMVYDDQEAMIADRIGTPVFSPDSRHLAYDACKDGRCFLVVDGKKNKTSPPHYRYHDKFFINASEEVVAIETRDNDPDFVRVTVSNRTFGNTRVKELKASAFVYNRDKTRIALVGLSHNGKKRLIEFAFDKPDIVYEGPLYDDIIYHTYAADNFSVAYVADKAGKRYVVLDGKEKQVPRSERIWSLVVRPDKKGIGILLRAQKGTFLHQAFNDHNGTRGKKYADAGGLIYSNDGSRYAYIATFGKGVFMVVNGKEGPSFDMVVTPQFSPDDRYLVYRARKDGKRFVVVADKYGKTIRQQPSHEQVFPVVFTADGKSIAYGVKDGKKLIWKVEKL